MLDLKEGSGEYPREIPNAREPTALGAIKEDTLERTRRYVAKKVRDEAEVLKRGFGIEIRKMEDGREGIFYRKHPNGRWSGLKGSHWPKSNRNQFNICNCFMRPLTCTRWCEPETTFFTLSTASDEFSGQENDKFIRRVCVRGNC